MKQPGQQFITAAAKNIGAGAARQGATQGPAAQPPLVGGGASDPQQATYHQAPGTNWQELLGDDRTLRKGPPCKPVRGEHDSRPRRASMAAPQRCLMVRLERRRMARLHLAPVKLIKISRRRCNSFTTSLLSLPIIYRKVLTRFI